MTERYKKLATQINYQFKDWSILEHALTHASDSRRKDDNESLEFLGDRVLGLVVAEYLFAHEEIDCVGDMAQHLAFLVSRSVCAKVAHKLTLSEYAYIAKNVPNSPNHYLAVYANLCEALIAALYLDGGLAAARNFIETFWQPWLIMGFDKGLTQSSKNVLQEIVQSLGGAVPCYRVVECIGPDHAPIFTVSVETGTLGNAEGQGASRQAAEKIAAENLLNQIKQGAPKPL